MSSVSPPTKATDRRPRGSSRASDDSVTPIAFPVFDDNGELIINWVEGLYQGQGKAVIPAMTAAHAQLNKVRNSLRHERLADFLHHAILAIESDEFEGARYILLTTLAAFGWSSHYGEK